MAGRVSPFPLWPARPHPNSVRSWAFVVSVRLMTRQRFHKASAPTQGRPAGRLPAGSCLTLESRCLYFFPHFAVQLSLLALLLEIYSPSTVLLHPPTHALGMLRGKLTLSSGLGFAIPYSSPLHSPHKRSLHLDLQADLEHGLLSISLYLSSTSKVPERQ